MSAFVVDTNVAVVANGKTEHADMDCVLACIDALENVILNGVIVIDDAMLILCEYMRHFSLSGQPGPGDYFMKWVWSAQADPRRCEQVRLTRRNDDPTAFNEYPADADLQSFDLSDRKFVAVAKASRLQPIVLNAVDSDWANYSVVLGRNGVHLEFLCPQHVRPKAE